MMAKVSEAVRLLHSPDVRHLPVVDESGSLVGMLSDRDLRALSFPEVFGAEYMGAVQAALAFDSGLGEARELLEDMLLWARADGERFRALFDAQIASAALQRAVGGL